MKDLTVLKIGGSIITEKSSQTPKALPDEINRIANEITANKGNLIVVHGAGSFGHPLARKYRLTEQFNMEGVIETHRSVRILNNIFVDALNRIGMPAVPVHPFGSFLLDCGRINEMLTTHILVMLDRGMVPVLHGDVVMDATKGASVLSGDQIVPYIAHQLGAEIIGIGSVTDGVLDDKGHTVPVITPASFDEVKVHIGGSSNTDVTGGMLGKVTELVDLADRSGISSRIFNASIPGNVSAFLDGATPGTLIQKEVSS
jgi:isopentenyl phosphate kinase